MVVVYEGVRRLYGVMTASLALAFFGLLVSVFGLLNCRGLEYL